MNTKMKTKIIIILMCAMLASCSDAVRVKTFDNDIIDNVRNPHYFRIGDSVIVERDKHMQDDCIYDGPIYWRDTTFHQDTYHKYVKGVIIK